MLNKNSLISQAAAEMIVALIDICIKCGFTEMYTFYNKSVKMLMDRVGFSPVATSKIIEFEKKSTLIARFSMTSALLKKVREKTGIVYQAVGGYTRFVVEKNINLSSIFCKHVLMIPCNMSQEVSLQAKSFSLIKTVLIPKIITIKL